MDGTYPPDCGTSSKRLTAANLARDFGPRSPVVRKCLPAVLALFSSPEYAARAEKALGSCVGGMKSAGWETSLAAMARRIDAGLLRFPAIHFLWALKLYYAAVVRSMVQGDGPDARNFLDRDFPADWIVLLRAASDAVFAAESGASRPSVFFMESNDFRGEDLFQEFYQALIPRPVRHQLGEYYTPPWLVEHVLDQLHLEDHPRLRILDPACGSGAFLLGAIRRLRRLPHRESVWQRVQGIDVNPLAVLTARANFNLVLGDPWPVNSSEMPIILGDSILGRFGETSDAPDTFDVIVGNPPWIAWDNLPVAYREATKPLWEQYGLFSLSATAARHGGGKKDLSMLMLYAAADRYLRRGGRLALVVTQTLFQTHGAGDGFRRFRLGPAGESLKVLRVDDFVEARPFGDAANWTSVIYLEKGAPTEYPVKYVKWRAPSARAKKPSDRNATDRPSTGARRGIPTEFTLIRARPIDPLRPTSPWFLQPAADRERNLPRLGPSEYQAHLGANSGGLNGVFWLEVLEKSPEGVQVRNVVEKGRQVLPIVETLLEPDLLYPLLRWGELRRWAAAPRLAVVLVQDLEKRSGLDETLLQRTFPRTYAYLRQFEAPLRARAAYRRYQSRGPFYSMYNVGPYTVAPIKVVWRRMDRQLTAAVVASREHPLLGSKPVIPQETCVFIPCANAEEAHYLCALLNSAPINFIVQSLSVRGGKSFGTPKILDYLRLQRFDPRKERHGALAALSCEAHRLREKGESVDQVQREIDELSEEMQRNSED